MMSQLDKVVRHLRTADKVECRLTEPTVGIKSILVRAELRCRIVAGPLNNECQRQTAQKNAQDPW